MTDWAVLLYNHFPKQSVTGLYTVSKAGDIALCCPGAPWRATVACRETYHCDRLRRGLTPVCAGLVRVAKEVCSITAASAVSLQRNGRPG